MSPMRLGRDDADRAFYLPAAAVTQTFGVLAKRRGGKSYTAAVMAEEFAAAKVPWVALDPTGAWWGLRASADGEKAGIPVVILGGAHGDTPLEATGGKIVADLVVDHPGFYVLDFEAFDSNAAQDRFVADFAERLYRRKATHRDPMHLFIDEADSFAPQRPGQNQLRMLGAIEAIVRRGGIRGLGTTLISQRAAVVNKNVLTQLDTLIVLQTTGPQDQDAEKDWVQRNATPAQFAEFKDSLASLPRGTAWVYSPENDIFERVTVRARRTFNSSATPEMGDKVAEPKKLATVDLEAVRAAMAASIEKAKADDPVLLRKRIAELERDLAKRPETVESVRTEYIEHTVPAFTDEDWTRLLKAMTALHDADDALRETNANLDTYLRAVAEHRHGAVEPPRFKTKRPGLPSATYRGVDLTPTEFVVAVNQAAFDETLAAMKGDIDVQLKAGARRMLDVLARHHPVRVSRAQWATLSKMKVTGGTWGTYFSTLKRAGLFTEEADGLISITETGLQVAGVEPGNPMSTEEVREVWRSKLKSGARNMLDALIDVHPAGVERATLAQTIGMEVTGGTFGTYLSTLRRNGLAEVQGDFVRASDTVMGGQA
jgi:hypothetical protein